MGTKLDILVHGRGNAWPVPLGEEHPFYDREDPRDLSNASFSLQLRTGDEIESSVLIDAGHGTVQSLLSGDNRIPDFICLTHGHLDHTLSVDWVVQSFWRKHRKERRYPIYATLPVYRFLVQTYPHLADLTEHRELEFGERIMACEELPVQLSPFPAYHGPGAIGASMLLFEYRDRRVLFTGDVLAPLLGKEDCKRLAGADLVVVDCNNRFPWPRTQHWSFAASPADFMKHSDILESFAAQLEWKQVAAPHLQEGISKRNRAYLSRLEQEWKAIEPPLTILEFMEQIRPKRLMLVHYSGAEDRKYYGEEILSAGELYSWATGAVRQAGIPLDIIVPETGQRMQID